MRCISTGSHLPVFVNEVLNSSEDSALYSVRFDTNDWLSLVCRRSLLLWQFSDKQRASVCYRLFLPASSLNHNSRLVAVNAVTTSQNLQLPPSATICSPEGTIRHWPNVAHKSIYFEHALDLQGQECHSMEYFKEMDCYVVCTTTSEIFMVEPMFDSGEANFAVTPMRASGQNMFDGVRRLSTFFFSSSPVHAENAFLKLIICESNRQIISVNYSGLHIWLIGRNSKYKLCGEVDLNTVLIPLVLEQIWGFNTVKLQEDNKPKLNFTVVDALRQKHNLVLLVACRLESLSRDLQFLVVSLNLTELLKSNTVVIQGLVRPNFTETVENANEFISAARSYSLCSRSLNSDDICVSSSKRLFLLTLTDGPEPAGSTREVLINLNNNDRIIGVGSLHDQIAVFSRWQGLLKAVPLDFGSAPSITTSMNSSILERSLMSANQPLPTIETLITCDAFIQYKYAFVYFMRSCTNESQTIMANLIGNITEFSFDKFTLKIADEIVDESITSEFTTSDQNNYRFTNSVIVSSQLEEKRHCFRSFMLFLRKFDLFRKLSFDDSDLTSQQKQPTVLILMDRGELLDAMISFNQISARSSLNDIFVSCLRDCMVNAGISSAKSMKNVSNLFAQRVTAVSLLYQFLPCFVTSIGQLLLVESGMQERIRILSEANRCILYFLQKATVTPALQYRTKHIAEFGLTFNNLTSVVLPWTARSEMKRSLLTLEQYCLDGLPDCSDPVVQSQLSDQCCNIIQIILDDCQYSLKWLLDSSGETMLVRQMEQQFEKERFDLLKPLVSLAEYEPSARLAEQFCDFGILIEICQLTNDNDRLAKYKSHFASSGFSDFLYQWYIEHDQPGSLFSEKENGSNLNDFLADKKQIVWLQQIRSSKFGHASETLSELARSEVENIARKRTMLSLAKLTHMCRVNQNDLTNDITVQEIERQLRLLDLQEDIPQNLIRECLNCDPKMVQTPRRLIEVCISEFNCDPNLFKIALDIMVVSACTMSIEELESTKLRIWCVALEKDRWQDRLNDDQNTDYIDFNLIGNTFLFRLLTVICQRTDASMWSEYVVTIEDLLSASSKETSLITFVTDPKFIIVLRGMYERLFSSNLSVSSLQYDDDDIMLNDQ